MNGKIFLRKSVKSAKFNVTLPKGVELNCFVDDGMRIFAESPINKNVYVRVSEMNIEKSEWEKFDGSLVLKELAKQKK